MPVSSMMRSLTGIIYGPSKSGKSTLAATAPYPRLFLDVEGGARFLPIVPKVWDPLREAPPAADGTWDTVVVLVRDYETMLKSYEWLRSGHHQFKSLIIDSISELQVKCIDNIAGSEAMKMQHWGELLRHMGNLLRDLRDLTMHATNPLEAVIMTALAKEGQDGRWRPYLQGQLATQAPYLFDMLGYLRQESFPNPDPSQPPLKARRLYIESTDFAEAGERVQGRLGSIVEQGDLSIEAMMNRIYGPREAPAAVPASVEAAEIPAAEELPDAASLTPETVDDQPTF